MTSFTTDAIEIRMLLDKIDPIRYAKTRNFLDGSVTYLSPYISRGVISTKTVFDHLKRKDYSWESAEKLVMELAWRDFFQLVWRNQGDSINEDIKQDQIRVTNREIPVSLIHAETGIDAIDSGIRNLYETGYMHNHLRMYSAALACNVAQCHWREPARWMYYNLLDGDWASNACSWQWVAGSFSNKKYYANQENINRYCQTNQTNTYLDVSYEELSELDIPRQLRHTKVVQFNTPLPATDSNFSLLTELPVLIFNWYNLDFQWHNDMPANRVLLIEPGIFARYPIGEKSMQFMLDLSRNIPEIQVFVGSFEELTQLNPNKNFIFKEHPLNNYRGLEEPREFLISPPNKNFGSFFGFWKTIEKGLQLEFNS